MYVKVKWTCLQHTGHDQLYREWNAEASVLDKLLILCIAPSPLPSLYLPPLSSNLISLPTSESLLIEMLPPPYIHQTTVSLSYSSYLITLPN